MNRIEFLIAQLCPDGLKFEKIKNLGLLYSGLTGKTKADFSNGDAKFVSYMNVYSNPSIKTDINEFVKINSGEKQNMVEVGDVFFTGSSETPDECGLSAVLTKRVNEPIYLNSFCFGLRFFDNTLFEPNFTKHLFRSDSIRKEINQTASGVTRFNISKKRFGEIIIPIPPLPIQQEIANILDKFTQLEAELEAELEARRVQYEYYSNELLNVSEVNGKWLMNGVDVEWKTLRDVGVFVRGNGLQKKDFTEAGVGCIHYGQIYTYYGNYAFETKSYTSLKLSEKLKKAKTGDIIIATTSENVEDVCKSVVWLGAEDICISGETYILKPNQNSKYIAYYLKTPAFFDFKKRNVTGTKVIRLHGEKLSQFQIPIPSLNEQERIVGILDKFDALVNDLSIGLPAELNARRKQYEYYRNKLLSFKPLNHG